MCCNRVNTDVLMANLFAAMGNSDSAPREVSVDTLRKYFRFLSERFPVYVASDFSEQAVEDCIEEHPELYQKIKGEDGQTVIRASGRKCPNLEFFNAPFSPDISTHIKRMTKLFLDTTHPTPMPTP